MRLRYALQQRACTAASRMAACAWMRGGLGLSWDRKLKCMYKCVRM